MEDLVGLIIFLVIIAINVVKFFAGAGKPKKSVQRAGETPPAKPASSIESFFENLAEQMAPKATELPDWPASRERPDYVQEMEKFEYDQVEVLEEEQPAEGVPVVLPPLPPVDREVGICLQGKENLKRAMLAHIVFSPPRAYDLSFDSTFARR